MAGLITLEHVRAAVALGDFDSDSARQRMAPVPRGWQSRPEPAKRAAVMLLVFPASDQRLHIVLTRRNADLRGHSGQVSFPGGQQDPGDASPAHTAMRETCEEIGVCGPELCVLSQLPRFYIPASHYEVAPIVAILKSQPVFKRNADEVAAVFSFALDDLLRARFKGEEQRMIRGYDVRVPFYAVAGHKVWGATAMLLSELEGRLRAALPSDIARKLE